MSDIMVVTSIHYMQHMDWFNAFCSLLEHQVPKDNFIHPPTKSCCWFSQTMVFPAHLWHVICPVCLGFRVSYSCTCLKYLAYSCACYFLWKWGKNDKSLLPLQQIEDVAFLATCFPLNIFPTGGKNVGYYSRPHETKNSCVNSIVFPSTYNCDRHAQQQFLHVFIRQMSIYRWC